MMYGNPRFSVTGFTITAVILFFFWSFRRRRALTERFVRKELVDAIALDFSKKRRVIKACALIAAVFLIMFSLMRPQWGFQWEEVKRSGLDILVAIDTSRSMLAADIKPNRLDRSKLAIRDMARKLKGDRIGLIAFAGTSFLQCPLTQDYGGFLLALDDITTRIIPRGGTSISSAIAESLKVFKGPEQKYKVLIVITDGEDHEGDAVKMAEKAKESGVRIFTVGVGTEEGELISAPDEYGKRGFVKDEAGNIVKSRLNEGILKRIALGTGGAYIRASGVEFGLNLIYDQTISKMEKRDIESKMRKRYQDRFQIFLACAVALLFIEPFIPDRRSART